MPQLRVRSPLAWPIALALLAAACCQSAAEEMSAKEILARTMSIHDQVRDYVCTVTVDMDFPNVRMSKRTFTVYFKKPDKLRVDSRGQLVILPKDVFVPGRLQGKVGKNANAVIIGKSTVNGRPVYALKILPADPERPERIMLWIWGDTWTFKRSELLRGSNKIMTVEWQHVRVGKFWMPAKVVCHVTGGEVAQEGAGTITITFANWRVNVGLSDDIFQSDSGSQKRNK